MADESSSRVRFSRLARSSFAPLEMNAVGPVRLKVSGSPVHREVPHSTDSSTVHTSQGRPSSDDIQAVPAGSPTQEHLTLFEPVDGKITPATGSITGENSNEEETRSLLLTAIPAGDTASFRTVAQGQLQTDIQDDFFVSQARQPVHELLNEPIESYSFAGFTAGAFPSVASVLTVAKGHLTSYPRLSDREECLLVPGSFSFSLQQGLAAAALAAVTLKYVFCERPKRSLKTFCFDFAKLVVGAILSQLMALRFSSVLSHVHLSWIHEGVDACDWYVVSQCADSSLGIWLVVKILRISEQRFTYESGQYGYRPGGKPAFKNFWGQLFIFIWIILVGKLLMFIVLGIFTKPLSGVAYTVLSALHHGNAEHRFFIIMVIVPVLTNLFQYTTLDSIVKYRKRSATKEEEAFFELRSKSDESRSVVESDDL